MSSGYQKDEPCIKPIPYPLFPHRASFTKESSTVTRTASAISALEPFIGSKSVPLHHQLAVWNICDGVISQISEFCAPPHTCRLSPFSRVYVCTQPAYGKSPSVCLRAAYKIAKGADLLVRAVS